MRAMLSLSSTFNLLACLFSNLLTGLILSIAVGLFLSLVKYFFLCFGFSSNSKIKWIMVPLDAPSFVVSGTLRWYFEKKSQLHESRVLILLALSLIFSFLDIEKFFYKRRFFKVHFVEVIASLRQLYCYLVFIKELQ